MNYREYQNTRNSVWNVLLNCRVEQLPVDLNRICEMLGIKALTYQDSGDFLEKYGLTALTRETDGFIFAGQDGPVILFDGTREPGRVRVTVAHELGHLFLGHVGSGGRSLACHRDGPARDRYERAADQFAARLLAPACILWGLDLHRPEEIAELCHISREAAEARARRMAVLYRRKRFLTSQVERQVFWSFQPFMSGYWSSAPEDR